jgi:hypothetical protein
MIPDGAGGWYIGGRFSQIGDATREALAHVLADGKVDHTFDARLLDNSEVESLALSGGTLYVGGAVRFFGTVSRDGLVAVDAATGAVKPFDAKLTRTGGYRFSVRALAHIGTRLFVAGTFDAVGGAQRRGLAAVDATSGAVTSWNPNPDQNGFPGSISSLTAAGDTLYAGGQFSSIGGQPRASLAQLRTSDGGATSWNPSADGFVRTLTLAGSTVYAGGEFAHAGGAARAGAAALSVGDGHALAWDAQLQAPPNSSPNVLGVAVDGATVYLAGRFSGARGEERFRAAALDGESGELRDWDPRVQVTVGQGAAEVYAVAAAGGKVVLGGAFTAVNVIARKTLAAIDVATGAPTGWAPEVTGQVSALVVDGSRVWAGGDFEGVTGAADCPNLAALDRTSATQTGPCPEPDGSVRALRIDGARIYLGGDFDHIGASTRSGIAALDIPGGTLASWAPEARFGGAPGTISTLSPGGGTVYAGGTFDHIGGQARTGVAKLSDTTGDASGWDAHLSSTQGFTPSVTAVARGGDRLFIGGEGFDHIGTQAAETLGAVNLTTGAAFAWAPGVAFAPNDNIETPHINALAVGPGGLIAVGSFDYLGLEHEGVGAISQTTTTGSTWQPRGFGFGASALAVSGGTVLAGNGEVYVFRSHGAPVFERGPALQTAQVLSYPGAIGCERGQYTGNRPFHWRYDWLRDGALLPGEGIEFTHGISDDDEGHLLACRITVQNDEGSAHADSPAIRAVPRELVNLQPPLLAYTPDGGLTSGAPLLCLPGAWGGTRPAIAYAWVRDGTVVGGEGTDRYTIRASDLGHEMRCRVTATNPTKSITLDSQPLKLPGGSGGGGGGGGGGGTGSARPLLHKLKLPARMKLRTFLRRGLRVRVTALRPMRSLQLALVLDPRTSAKLRLSALLRKRTLRSVKVGRTTVVLKPSRRGRRALRKVKRAQVAIASRAVGRDGRPGRDVGSRIVTLRR